MARIYHTVVKLFLKNMKQCVDFFINALILENKALCHANGWKEYKHFLAYFHRNKIRYLAMYIICSVDISSLYNGAKPTSCHKIVTWHNAEIM